MITNSISANLEWIKSVTLDELMEYLKSLDMNIDEEAYYWRSTLLYKTLEGGIFLDEIDTVKKLYQYSQYYYYGSTGKQRGEASQYLHIESKLFIFIIKYCRVLTPRCLDFIELLIENGANYLLFESPEGIINNIKTNKIKLIEIAIYRKYNFIIGINKKELDDFFDFDNKFDFKDNVDIIDLLGD